MDWGSEFAQLRAVHVKSVAEEESNKELVKMCKKHMSFKTPAKANALGSFSQDINGLTDLNHVISELATLNLNGKGKRVEQEVDFSEEGLKDIVGSFREHLDYLSDHSSIVFNLLSNTINVIDCFVKPLETVLSGLSLDLAAVKGSVGNKDLTQANVPPILWTAVETGFSNIFKLELDVTSIKSSVEDLQGFAEQLLEDITSDAGHSTLGADLSGVNAPSDKNTRGKDMSNLLGAAFAASTGQQHEWCPTSSDLKLKLRGNNQGNRDPGRERSQNGNDNDEEHDQSCCPLDSVCLKCKLQMDGLEADILSNRARLANIEQVNVQASLMGSCNQELAPLSYSFVHQVPEKVLRSITTSILNGLEDVDSDIESINSEVTLL